MALSAQETRASCLFRLLGADGRLHGFEEGVGVNRERQDELACHQGKIKFTLAPGHPRSSALAKLGGGAFILIYSEQAGQRL